MKAPKHSIAVLFSPAVDSTKVYVWQRNGRWYATRRDIQYSTYHNPLGRGCHASAAYDDYVSQII